MADPKAQFWDLCAKLTDFELCNRIAIVCEDLADESRSWPHIVIDQLWSFHGFTGGEGLAASAAACFFESVSLRPIAEAYDVIGLPTHSAIVWRLAAISDEANSVDEASMFQETKDFVSFLSERIDIDGSEGVFFDREAGLENHLVTFVRSNLSAFESLER